METIVIGEAVEICNLQDLEDFLEQCKSRGLSAKTPISIDCDHAMFSGVVGARINHNEGYTDEQYIDFFYDRSGKLNI